MSDKKISEFVAATDIAPTDILPLVSGIVNKKVTVGLLSLNMPNVGNKGISKNLIFQPSTLNIPLTSTVYNLQPNASPYILGSGADGQEITIVSQASNIVNVTSGSMVSLTFTQFGTATLIFVSALSKWLLKSSYNVNVL